MTGLLMFEHVTRYVMINYINTFIVTLVIVIITINYGFDCYKHKSPLTSPRYELQ
jgi:hypothetical protein